MIRYIIGNKEKGNLFKDGRAYKNKKSAKVALERVEDLVVNELEIMEIDVVDELAELKKENEKLKAELFNQKEAKKELFEKDKTITHLSSECTRLFNPTRKFWNEDKDKVIAEAREVLQYIYDDLSGDYYEETFLKSMEKAKTWLENNKENYK